MRVIPVPDQVRAMPWCIKTTVYSAPNGDLTDEDIAPAEALHVFMVPEIVDLNNL